MNKEKFTMYLDQEMIEWLNENTEDELTKSGLIRNLIRTAMDDDKKVINNEKPLTSLKGSNENLSKSGNYLNNFNLIDSLEKLVDFKNKGEITEEEYKIFKSKLLEI